VNQQRDQFPELDVAHVAKLARLNLTEEETKLFQAQLGRVLEYARKLQELDVSAVEDAAHAVPIFNLFRADEPRSWLTAEEVLANAPRQANGLFVVPKVVE
jgi:aspartyl-tRNA(Asn)/glutamyl-tRNA(Gln) amidotransferase subunit C